MAVLRFPFQSGKNREKQPVLAAVPSHVAVIMDGNGRWALSRGMPRPLGHRKGVEATRNFVENAGQLGIKEVTLYAFSSENWERSPEEVNELMQLLRQYLESEKSYFIKKQARLRIIGDRSRLAADIIEKINDVEQATAAFNSIIVNVALSYGGRQELTHAMQKIAAKVAAGAIKPDDINESTIQQSLYSVDMTEPDLLIRTGGDQRVSNFLLWQMAYTEFYFTPVLWPDFGGNELRDAVADYQGRERRFGKERPHGK